MLSQDASPVHSVICPWITFQQQQKRKGAESPKKPLMVFAAAVDTNSSDTGSFAATRRYQLPFILVMR